MCRVPNRGAAETHPTPAVRTQSCVFGFVENRQFSCVKPDMWDALRGQSAWRVFIRVISRALGRASCKTWILRHATFFLHLDAASFVKVEVRKGMHK